MATFRRIVQNSTRKMIQKIPKILTEIALDITIHMVVEIEEKFKTEVIIEEEAREERGQDQSIKKINKANRSINS